MIWNGSWDDFLGAGLSLLGPGAWSVDAAC
jgi:hypothetical protein